MTDNPTPTVKNTPIRCQHNRWLVGGWNDTEPQHCSNGLYPGENPRCDDEPAKRQQKQQHQPIAAADR